MAIIKIKNQDSEFPVEGILFDKDGTLLDFMTLWGKWAKGMTDQVITRVKELGGDVGKFSNQLLGINCDQQGEMIDYDLHGPLSIGSTPELEGVLAWQLYRCGLPWNEAITEIRTFWRSASGGMEQSATPLPGLPAFLKECLAAGIPMAVVTADDTQEAIKHLSSAGIAEYFQHIIGADQVAQGKPAPDIVWHACRELGLDPGKVAVIGDTGGDMQMGKAAGVALTIGIDRGMHLPHADLMIRSYQELSIEP